MEKKVPFLYVRALQAVCLLTGRTDEEIKRVNDTLWLH